MRIDFTNARQIRSSNRYYSFADEYLLHVPSRVFVYNSTNTCPLFLRRYASTDEYFPRDFERVGRMLGLGHCLSLASVATLSIWSTLGSTGGELFIV